MQNEINLTGPTQMVDEKSESPSTTAQRSPPPLKSGILSVLPDSWIPYAELMRLDRPAGFYAFYIPYLIGLSYGANLASPAPSPSHLLSLAVLFALYSILLRGAACAWNDNIDQAFDRKVARCRLRPIARGAITTPQAHIFTFALLVATLPIFLLLPKECIYHALPITILFGAYAFMKRITYYPQLALGFPFAWALLLSCAALGVDTLGPERGRKGATMSLFTANVLWTMIYDTVYAHQDVEDDIKAGVKSMAVRFRDCTKVLATTLAVGMVGLLGAAGWAVELGVVYSVVGCGGCALALGVMIAKVDLKDGASCAWFFHRGFWYVGGNMVAGLFGAYLQRWCRLSDKDLVAALRQYF